MASSDPAASGVSESELDEILRSAEAFATAHLGPLNREGDCQGSSLEAGRIITPPTHKPAWQAYCDGDWLLLDADQPPSWIGRASTPRSPNHDTAR